MIFSDEQLRAMYVGGRGNTTARRFAKFWARVLGTGLFPRRWVTLEVPGRRTGRTTRFPLGMADWQGDWYLVSMLGNDCDWVRNVRAAGGRATIRHGRARACRLVEVPAAERAPILQRYLRKVPGARPHFPVDRSASLAEFAAIAPHYPAFRVENVVRREKRRWLRWTLIGVAALLTLAVGLTVAAVRLQPTPAPLALPAAAAAPAGPLDGSYRAAPGSVAGFRVEQTVLGLTSEVVGRTSDVTGTATIADGRIGEARLRIGLRALTSGEAEPAPQFGTSLDTQRFPDADVTLTQPVTLDPAFASGTTATVNATGTLTLHGVTRTVGTTLAVRRDGADVHLAGAVPVAFADFGVAGPQGYGALGSLADRGTAEFLIILRRI